MLIVLAIIVSLAFLLVLAFVKGRHARPVVPFAAVTTRRVVPFGGTREIARRRVQLARGQIRVN